MSGIGLGCVTFGREIDEETSHRMLDYAFGRGIRFFDTASAYAEGASETIVGNWLASRRPDVEDLTIATKFQPPFTVDRVNAAVDESLARLGVPGIDLLYLHQWDESANSIEFLAALDAVVRDGRARKLGISNCGRSQLGHLLTLQNQKGFRAFSVLQNNFNYAVSDVDPDYREFCKRHGVAVVTYSPLGAGFLTGKHKRVVERGSRFDLIPGHQDVYFHQEAEKRLARLEDLGKRTGHSQAHLALSWAMHQPGIDYVLIGARKQAHIDQALMAGAFDDPGIFAEMDS